MTHGGAAGSAARSSRSPPARLFYRPDALDPWPLGAEMPWSLLYRMAPWITASLVLGALS